MRALLQRTIGAHVISDGVETGRIDAGLVALVGVTHDDTRDDARRLAGKIANLRIFDDEDGSMNLSLVDVGQAALVISQFTLYGDTRKGRRPSWTAAARPEAAEPLIEAVVKELQDFGVQVQTGRFRTDMQVSLVNDGPVTVLVEV